MTRKDYVAVAEILSASAREFMPLDDYQELINDFSDFFIADNPNFSHERFYTACFNLN